MKRYMVFLAAAAIIISVSIVAYPSLFKDEAVKSESVILFTGDIMMHVAVKECAADNDRINERGFSTNSGGFDFLFERIRPTLSGSDLAVGNMEFPVAEPYTSDGFIFNSPPGAVSAIKGAGFDLVSIANNHMLDQKENGVHSTIALLENTELLYMGAGRDEEKTRDGVVLNINGIRVGFISYTGILNYPLPEERGFFLNILYDREKLFKDIKEIKKRCDFLVMQPHSGTEYTLEPEDSDRALYRECLERGVNLIVGHHPHVLQSSEKYTAKDGRTCHIFYSLGNFISDQKRFLPIDNSDFLDIRDSAIVKLTLSKRETMIEPKIEVIPIHTENIRWPERRIQTYNIFEEIKRAESIKNPNERVSRIAYLNERISAIKKVLFKGDQELTFCSD